MLMDHQEGDTCDTVYCWYCTNLLTNTSHRLFNACQLCSNIMQLLSSKGDSCADGIASKHNAFLQVSKLLPLCLLLDFAFKEATYGQSLCLPNSKYGARLRRLELGTK